LSNADVFKAGFRKSIVVVFVVSRNPIVIADALDVCWKNKQKPINGAHTV